MKKMIHTRDNYEKETTEIIRIISDYRTLMYEQIMRIFNKKSEIAQNIIARLINQKRIIYDVETAMLSYGLEQETKPDMDLIKAFWVLVDFYDNVEFHYPSEYPAQIAFFMDSKLYEIIKADYGKEAVINHALSIQTPEQPDRIIIVDKEEQIPEITADNILCFCIVGKKGKIEYFKFE